MARGTVKVTEAAQQEAAKGGGDFKPLDAGIYNVTIVDAEETKITNEKSPNKGTTGVRLQLRVSEGQKGTNRRLFQTVYDVERWNPKPGKDEGTVNWLFSQFYKSLGLMGESAELFELPDIEDLLGEALAVKVKIVPDTYKYKKALEEWNALPEKADGTKATPEPVKGDFLTNDISEFLPEQDIEDVAEAADDDEDGFELG